MRQPVPFGKYLLLDRISVGGMAEVFKAKSYGVEGFEKIIAIKRILPTMGEDRDFIKMFIDEAKIAGQLAHANICQIFELGRIDGSHFIAMEYIWGKDLLQIQNRVRKLKQQIPISMACFAIAKVLEGLDYAHRKRDPLGRPLEIVHRDCSPQNVLVSYEGEVKVIDFGIAKATSRNSRTMAGVLKGKFGYMSPEQVRGLPLDRRSDIFAIGTMLYECLTGERLFQGETDFSTLEKVRNVDIQAPRSINPDIPDAVERIILKALAKDVDDRYQWCSEMLADLQAYLMSQDVVFTAKSMSSWLKDLFAQEIDRERSQLETYKRVGRDGLIAGVPSAEAKLDVVEHLGEAGIPEGDATTLGGPNFDEMEMGVGASPDVGTPAAGRRAQTDHDDEDDNDFGEEAPTEIFGELEHGQVAVPAPAPSRAPTASQPPQSRPPKPPPGRPTTQQPMVAQGYGDRQSGPQAAMRPQQPMQPMAQPMPHQMMPEGYPPQAYPQNPPFAAGFGTPSQPQMAMQGPQSGPQMAMGTPGALAVGQPHVLQTPQPGRTVLGMTAPQGLGNYGGNYRPSQQQPAQYPQNYPPQNYPSGQMQYPGYPNQYGGSGQMPVAPIDQVVEGKKSTLVRDIGIGVVIAALVLGGFLLVKMFVLDNDNDSSTTPTSTMATIRVSLPGGTSAKMYLDDTVAAAAVRDKDEIPVTAGVRHVLFVGPNGAKCDEKAVKLDAGKTTTLECKLDGGAPPATGSGSAGSAAGSASPPVTNGSAAPGATATVPADTKAQGVTIDTKAQSVTIDTKAADTKPADTKPADTKPADTKAQSVTIDTKAQSVTIDTKPKPIKPKPIAVDTNTKPADPKPDSKPDPKPIESKPVDTGKGYLQVFSKPAAKILVDGVETGMNTPIGGHSLQLAPGKHKVTFVIGDDRFTYPVTIKAGSTETMSKDLQ